MPSLTDLTQTALGYGYDHGSWVVMTGAGIASGNPWLLWAGIALAVVKVASDYVDYLRTPKAA